MGLVCAALVSITIAIWGCSFEASTREDFARDVPTPIPPNCTLDVFAWRATAVTIEMPEGLAVFQLFIDDAIDTDNLNFVIAQDGDEFAFDASPWPLRVGDAAALGGGCYAMSEIDPPAITSATVDTAGADAWPVETPADLEFTVIARLPFAVPIPVTAARITATASRDGSALVGAVVEGAITAEAASAALIDVQSDGNPDNDTPLISFMGEPDLDLDGDGIVDDFAARFSFEAERTAMEKE